ncbi:hypothetical protein BU24DRAFT_419607 [Aaosphaeria arxii CBS 175.79]|uniref:Uncharacterized protein n=1 Tax=Aaosphaeria arxii CBS 175.79 TaxID=1450172 RepID=A0A6A5Y4Q8_9PLEO|nr:uncharacterized protein BU24DRAFT_419607 [Aaosphaeria arxii CBS 175.79]KAF2020017.1 hypothetical protein BU24DRAFT_419607 [Aaosphaeria arxii CBS 175.79]
MVRITQAIFLGLQAMSGLVTALPAATDDVAKATATPLSIEDIFASAVIENDVPSVSIPKDSVFDTTGVNASSHDNNQKRGLSKRFLLDSWQEVDVHACWSIDGVNVDHTAYINDVATVIRVLANAGRAGASLPPLNRWIYQFNNVRVVIRNQNACQTRNFISNELAQNLEAIWYRCQNHASGWGMYTWQDLSGNTVGWPDLIFFVQPINAAYPPYSATSC